MEILAFWEIWLWFCCITSIHLELGTRMCFWKDVSSPAKWLCPNVVDWVLLTWTQNLFYLLPILNRNFVKNWSFLLLEVWNFFNSSVLTFQFGLNICTNIVNSFSVCTNFVMVDCRRSPSFFTLSVGLLYSWLLIKCS